MDDLDKYFLIGLLLLTTLLIGFIAFVQVIYPELLLFGDYHIFAVCEDSEKIWWCPGK